MKKSWRERLQERAELLRKLVAQNAPDIVIIHQVLMVMEAGEKTFSAKKIAEAKKQRKAVETADQKSRCASCEKAKVWRRAFCRKCFKRIMGTEPGTALLIDLIDSDNAD